MLSRMDVARFGTVEARGVVEVRQTLDGLDEGFWAVVVEFEGSVTAVRFAQVGPVSDHPDPGWPVLDDTWTTSLDQSAYQAGVEEVRRRIAAGTVYQANLCRILEHPLPADADLDGLAHRLAAGNPAPYAARIRADTAGLDLVCASPEAFLLRAGDRITSRPIKGTATDAALLLAKDHAENVMIADLVRNDLARVSRPGTVSVEALCAPEEHPGLVHLVTTVSADLRPEATWSQVLAATFPPGSVSGAPKSTALATIADLEPVLRGPYCGAVGWIDADHDRAELAVGIRTFWSVRVGLGRVLRFGTGAGITWGSDPHQEWAETELKAARLTGLASGRLAG